MTTRGIGTMFGALVAVTATLVASVSGAGAAPSRSFTPSPAQDGWLVIAAGELHTCGIREDHTLWCWGESSHGEVGEGCGSYCLTPTQVGVDADWKRVSVGYVYTCGIRLDGTLWCWGGNSGGNLGLGDRIERHTPTQVGADTDWAQVDAAMFHTCGIRGDHLYCWGYNPYGQLGLGDTSDRLVPTQVGAATWTQVEAGDDSSCGIRPSHALWCWGANEHGQLGVGDTTERDTPTRVGSDLDWASVAIATWGGRHTCGVRRDATLWCWGWGHFGQLGLGYPASRYVPTQVQPGTPWSGVAAGSAHTCATAVDGSAWCWGRGRDGQLGLGRHTTAHPLPTQVGDRSDWAHITVGESHTCAMGSTHAVWCWGWNDFGQLGVGDRTNRYRPTPL